jgi:hypothetical protein
MSVDATRSQPKGTAMHIASTNGVSAVSAPDGHAHRHASAVSAADGHAHQHANAAAAQSASAQQVPVNRATTPGSIDVLA